MAPAHQAVALRGELTVEVVDVVGAQLRQLDMPNERVDHRVEHRGIAEHSVRLQRLDNRRQVALTRILLDCPTLTQGRRTLHVRLERFECLLGAAPVRCWRLGSPVVAGASMDDALDASPGRRVAHSDDKRGVLGSGGDAACAVRTAGYGRHLAIPPTRTRWCRQAPVSVGALAGAVAHH